MDRALPETSITAKLKPNIRHTGAAILHWKWRLHSSWGEEAGSGALSAWPSAASRSEDRYHSNDLKGSTRFYMKRKEKNPHPSLSGTVLFYLFIYSHTLTYCDSVFIAQEVVLIAVVILSQHPLLAFGLGMYL